MMAEEFKGEYYMKYIREKMKYNLKSDSFCGQILSLKCQMLSKVLANLWLDHLGQDNLRWINIRSNFHYMMDDFEKKVQKKISHFLIPLNCKKDLEHMCKIIKKELIYFFAEYVMLLSFTSLDEVNIFRNICWTPQGTINKVKTAAQIIEHTTLSTKQKYDIACMNCLEENIRDLIKILPEDFLIPGYQDDDYFFLLRFWAFYVKGEQKKLSKLTMGKEIWIYLLEQSTMHGPFDVAVQYIFENFVRREQINETWIEFLYGSIREYGDDSNRYIYLWQEIPEIQRYMINVELNKRFLLKIHHISKFSSVPPLVTYVHETIKHFDIGDAFEIILFCWREKIIDVEQYITFWNELTLDLEEYPFFQIFELIFQPHLEAQIDFLPAKLLLKKGTLENIKDLIITGYFFCSFVICSGGPVFLDNLFCQVFKVESKISDFKSKFFISYGLYIIAKLVAFNKFEWIEEFIDKFCASKKLNEIKNDMLYVQESIFIHYIKSHTDEYNFDFLTALDNFLNWNFNGNKEEIGSYTSTVFVLETDSYSEVSDIFFEVVRDLIEEEEWEFVERYWKWIYSATREQISSIKGKLTRMIKILLLSSNYQFISSSMSYVLPHKLFKRLATSCFKPDELEALKQRWVKNHLQFLVKELLKNDRHQEVHDLLDWFFSSDEAKIDEFKTEFMLSHLGRTFLFNSITDSNLNTVIFLFKRWLNCSIDSATLFQHRFSNFVKVKIDSERQNLDENKEIKNIVGNRMSLNKIIQNCNFLKDLLYEKINLEKCSIAVVDPNANQN